MDFALTVQIHSLCNFRSVNTVLTCVNIVKFKITARIVNGILFLSKNTRTIVQLVDIIFRVIVGGASVVCSTAGQIVAFSGHNVNMS